MLDKPQPQLLPDLYNQAVTYAALGFAVLPIHSVAHGCCSCGQLPCKSAGKHPISSLVPHGVKDATKDLETIRQWWAKSPGANVGIAAGRISNLVVVDIDGEAGRETLCHLVGDNSPATDWTVTTGRKDGGAHLYFRYPESGVVPSYKYGGLEIRSDRQYVVAPPSVHHSGNRYSWSVFNEKMSLLDTPLDPLPEVFLGFAVNKLKPGADDPREAGRKDDVLMHAALGRSIGIPPLHTQHEENRVRQALASIPSDERDTWLMVGMALHWTRWPSARAIWDDWSEGSEKFDEADQDKTWLGFRVNRDQCTTLGSLFKLAQGNGWKPFSDEIDEVNAKFFLLNNYGGHSVVGWLDQNETGTGITLQVQKHKDFTMRFSNRFVTNEATGKTVSLGNYWLNHQWRREYEGVELVPGGPQLLPGNKLNLWLGYGIEPRKGSWELMQQHIAKVLSDGDEKAADYITRYAAWIVQNPGERPEVALVLRGDEGTGKGVFLRCLLRIFGPHGLHISDRHHLAGKFNAHLHGCLFLFADEAYWPGDKAAEGVLKARITESTIAIEPKGFNVISAKNRLKIVMASNNDWVVPTSAAARRFAVFDVSDRYTNINSSQEERDTYFGSLHKEIESGAWKRCCTTCSSCHLVVGIPGKYLTTMRWPNRSSFPCHH